MIPSPFCKTEKSLKTEKQILFIHGGVSIDINFSEVTIRDDRNSYYISITARRISRVPSLICLKISAVSFKEIRCEIKGDIFTLF